MCDIGVRFVHDCCRKKVSDAQVWGSGRSAPLADLSCSVADALALAQVPAPRGSVDVSQCVSFKGLFASMYVPSQLWAKDVWPASASVGVFF